VTYNKYYKEKLNIITSIYDPCLLIINIKEGLFSIVKMQTNDIFILGTKNFKKLEEEELVKAKLLAKPKEVLLQKKPFIFNSYTLS